MNIGCKIIYSITWRFQVNLQTNSGTRVAVGIFLIFSTIQGFSRATYILHIFAGLCLSGHMNRCDPDQYGSANNSPQYASVHWHNLFCLESPHLFDTLVCAVRTFCNYWADVNLKNINRFLENFFNNTQWIQTKEHLEGKDILTQVRAFFSVLFCGSIVASKRGTQVI